MAIFKNRKLKIEDIKVATTKIISSFCEQDSKPICVKVYFVVKQINGKYYEVFSGKEFEQEDIYNPEVNQKLDTPYIVKLEPLLGYIKNPTKKYIEKELLFDFITKRNIFEKIS